MPFLRAGLTAALTLALASAADAQIDDGLCRDTRMCSLTFVETLATAPFPYAGVDPTTGQPFFDTTDPTTGQPAHTTADGLVYPHDPHYGDGTVLFHVPQGFRHDQPFAVLVFFHHHATRLPDAVMGETAVIDQVDRAGRNILLIAPQLAVNAIDSAAGKLYRPDGLAALLAEAAAVLAERVALTAEAVGRAPVVLASYSGGYRALAYAMDRGGLGDRLAGLLLLDGVFDQVDLFERHLAAADRRSWFVVVYSPRSAGPTEALRDRLARTGVALTDRWPAALPPGTTAFLRVDTPHRAVPIAGPPAYPLAAALAAAGRETADIRP